VIYKNHIQQKEKFKNAFFYLLIASVSKKHRYYFETQKMLVFLLLFKKYQ